jgi:2,4-dienoyl-CoA reductase-like NADH-dependent reductase (Old Yellow Enzyme family)/pyruvate/2-oxoglutarate dehydrogenase complex dihydrolipoamide dehydrogenase (E3) component
MGQNENEGSVTDNTEPQPNMGVVSHHTLQEEESRKMFKHLFSPIKIGSMEVKNRIVMPPMGTLFGAPDGTVTERHLNYYEARAKGGAGLIIAEVTTPNAARKYGMNTLGLFDDGLIPSWRGLAKAVHSHGAKLATQLLDPGPETATFLGGLPPVGPSIVASRMWQQIPKELSIEEIEGVIDDFAEAARRGREAGLDAIEIHAAHGYAMVGSFLSPFFNKRTDIYGGSLERRLKLLLEIVKRIKAKAGGDFPIIVRMSGDDRVPGGRTIQETQFIAPILVEAGVDALEISGGSVPATYWAVVPPSGTPLALNAPFAEAVKQVVSVPVICVGRINSPQLAEFVIANGKADLVSMGRALMADPEMPKKAAAGDFEDIAPCVADNYGCIGSANQAKPATCIMNPAMGREKEMAIVAAKKPKRVLVAGGGPAGLEVAWVAALRGHQVSLFEKERKLGGQVNLASVPPYMQEISQLITYLSRQIEKAGVKVELGTEVTPELVQKMKPHVVIVATGAAPMVPDDIPGIDKEKVVTAWDILAGKAAQTARNVVILGGGLVGCETADFMTGTGDNLGADRTDVTILEMLENVALDMVPEPRHLLMQRLHAKGVKILTSAKVKEILDDGVLFVRDGQEESIHNVDSIILALGARAVDSLSEKIKGKVAEVYVIGDAKEPHKVLEATAEGAEVGRKI